MRVLQLIDSLNVGGAERMALNIANALSAVNVESHLCATRVAGPLKSELNSNVRYFHLGKSSFADVKAILKLRSYIKRNKINIIHAHGTSFFTAVLMKLTIKEVALVWHDHFGNRPNDPQRIRMAILKWMSKYFDLVYCVNQELLSWAKQNLKSRKFKFLSNFPVFNSKQETVLKGAKGKRILCVANLRHPKNHIMLLRAFNQLPEAFKDWSLHCVGSYSDAAYYETLKDFINTNQLHERIFFYGQKNDIAHIISQADIGVLTSSFEGLPMALLEYGLGGLPVIATNIGHIQSLINAPKYGILVENKNEKKLIEALIFYISDKSYRLNCAKNFNKKVIDIFAQNKVIEEILSDYNDIIRV